MEFDAVKFMKEDLSVEKVEALRKDDLLELAEHLKLSVTRQTKRLR